MDLVVGAIPGDAFLCAVVLDAVTDTDDEHDIAIVVALLR
jgi:hypothetical protein